MDSFKEGLKEFARVCLLAALPIIIDGISRNELNLRIVGITVALAGLKFIDKLLHENAKDTPKSMRNEGIGGVKGITGF